MAGLFAILSTLRAAPYGTATHDSGDRVNRYVFTIGDSHPLLLAGLPAHSRTLIALSSNATKKPTLCESPGIFREHNS